MEKTADISPSGKYRYHLGRIWGGAFDNHALFVMLNPSTADADTYIPLGSVANRADREARKAAHAAFDRFWRPGPDKGRGRRRSWCYAWLCTALQVDPKDCHIGEFDAEQCRRVVHFCSLIDDPQQIFDPAPAMKDKIARIAEEMRTMGKNKQFSRA